MEMRDGEFAMRTQGGRGNFWRFELTQMRTRMVPFLPFLNYSTQLFRRIPLAGVGRQHLRNAAELLCIADKIVYLVIHAVQ